MSSEFDVYTEEEPRRSWLKSCFFVGITVFVILGLLGSGVAGVSWLLARRAEETAVTTPQPDAVANSVTVEVTAVPTTTATRVIATSPAGEPANSVNRIVFINTDGQVETISPDGGDSRLLTDTDFNYQFPAWSPDGSYLAVIGGDVLGGGIYLLTDEEGPVEPQELYFDSDQTPIYLYWSPDNRQVSFIASHPDDDIGLHLAPVEDDAESRLLTTGSPFYWDWAAGGNQLLIHTGFAGDEARLALIEANGDGSGENLAAPGFFQAPGISADGRYLAYAEAEDTRASRLVVADMETGQQHQEEHDGLVAMGWSPTANQLAFVSATRDAPEFLGPLQLLEAETGQVRLLSDEIVLAFFWSPDGRYLAYISVSDQTEGDITAARPSVPAERRPSRAKGLQQRRPTVLNLRVVDVAAGTGRHLTTFTPTILFLAQFLPFFDQYALSHRLWSPDSDALVLPMQDNGINRIFVVPASGGRVRALAEGSIAFWSQQ